LNFFEHQDAARSRTTRLLVLFSLAIGGLTLGVYALLLVVAPFAVADTASAARLSAWRPDLLLASAASVGGIIGLASFVKVKSLGSGGSAVAESVGGRRVSPQTTDPRERRLMNVVEEMAIASGVPVPAVYVLDNEAGINAFAAGYTVGDAAVAVTRGALELFNRAELQAVVAHEFAHILNGDMRLNIRLIGILFGLMMIGTTGAWVMRAAAMGGRSTRRNNDAAPTLAIIIIGLTVWLLGSIGLFFGRLIQRAISRQREFLADASAVQFTRDTSGLVGALKKIGGYSSGSQVHAREAQEMSHMFFGDAIGRTFGTMLATHPPLEERIRRLDPGFDGEFEAVARPSSPNVQQVAGFSGAPGAPPLQLSLTDGAAGRLDPGTVVGRVGTATPEHLEYSTALLEAIPDELRHAARSGLGAAALTYALLLDPDDPKHASAQLDAVRESTHPRIAEELDRLAPHAATLDPRARLPLLELAAAGLRQLSAGQYAQFRKEVAAITAADGRLSLFEFAVNKSLFHWLDAAFGLAPRRATQYHALRPLAEPISVMLSALAYVGHEDFPTASAAFHQGASRLRRLPPGLVALLSPAECAFDRLDRALDMLAMASPAIKAQVIDAAAHCVLADSEVTIQEAELLRVVSDALDAPIPPFLPRVASA
jgi:Zn-dependent protease with chaperone function